ncbi:phospholipid phosphatase 1-like [Gigantopelta aegis]|uniref:phospholipid phosphatase 1-like n=1 Tax=Gigantopelta aegis TaxID=1735272 RepID=UPI001B88E1D1|nr:phospholipid phosphatase 1-like [Gigantopelta aegis]
MDTRMLKKIKLGVDVLFIAALFVAVVTLYAVDMHPFQRGFFCSDESLKYPYRDDTVTMVVAGAVGLIAMLITIFVLEGIRTWIVEHAGTSSTREKAISYVKSVVWNVAVMLFGTAFHFLLVELLKLSIGRLRPHFFDLCKPDFNTINCTSGYVTHYTCTATVDTKKLNDAHKSFPSGHASFIAYSMTYVIVYLQLRLPRHSFRLMRASLQFCSAMVALYVCVSRISDYKHHWSDVISGGVIGTLVAVLTIAYISDLVPRRQVDGSTSDSGTVCAKTNSGVTESYKKNDIEMQRE